MGAVVSRLDITLEEAKTFLRVDGDEDDGLIEDLISSAKQAADAYLNNPFEAVSEELVGRGDGEETEYQLEHFPAYNVTVYLNGTKTEAYTLDPAEGEIVFNDAPAYGIRITADYEAELPIPDMIKAWCLARTAREYEHRTESVAQQSDPAGSVTWGPQDYAPIFRWRRSPGF
jgi:hypothetical protein